MIHSWDNKILALPWINKVLIPKAGIWCDICHVIPIERSTTFKRAATFEFNSFVTIIILSQRARGEDAQQRHPNKRILTKRSLTITTTNGLFHKLIDKNIFSLEEAIRYLPLCEAERWSLEFTRLQDLLRLGLRVVLSNFVSCFLVKRVDRDWKDWTKNYVKKNPRSVCFDSMIWNNR